MENREQEKGKEKKKENDEQRTGKEKQGMKVYRSSCFVSKAFFFDTNHNRRDRLPKQKRSMSSKEK